MGLSLANVSLAFMFREQRFLSARLLEQLHSFGLLVINVRECGPSQHS